MNINRERFVEKSIDGYSPPPRSFRDRDAKSIQIREYRDDDFEHLFEMYKEYDPSQRAQGIPPVSEKGITDWIENITSGENIIALNDEGVIGHAILMPDREDIYELAIFVHQDYQGRGIGTELIESLLAHAKKNGIEYIWLTVERWNEAALNLYRKVGFESIDSENFEIEMGMKINGEEL